MIYQLNAEESMMIYLH